MSNLAETRFAYPKTLEFSRRFGSGEIDVVFDCHPRKVCAHLLSVACELWLRGQIASVEDVLLQTARALTIRLAEKLA